MYSISISLNTEKIPQSDAEAMLQKHREWFAKYFNQGNFLIVGPYNDEPFAGIIIAHAESREALDSIITDDVYYPDFATYTVRDFAPKMVAENIVKFKE